MTCLKNMTAFRDPAQHRYQMTMSTHEIYTGHCLIKLAPGTVPSISIAQKQRSFASLWPETDRSSPASTKPLAAREKALNTVEILEQILLELRWNELFVLQSTCRTWQAVIQNSVQAREKMYILSQEAPLQPVTNMEYFGRSMDRVIYRSGHLETNPATKFYGAADNGLHNPLALWVVRDLSNFIQLSIGVEGTPESSPEKTPSWRHMLLTKPALTAVSFDFLPDDEKHGYKLAIYNRTGVTFGDVYDWTWRLCKSHELATGVKPAGRLAAIVFWLAHPDGGDEMEEIW